VTAGLRDTINAWKALAVEYGDGPGAMGGLCTRCRLFHSASRLFKPHRRGPIKECRRWVPTWAAMLGLRVGPR
jgi:hypothetical protein